MSQADIRHLAPEEVLDRLGRVGLIAVVRSATKADALGLSRVLVEAGVPAVEVTYTTPDAPEVMASLRAEVGEHVLLGVGTIRSVGEALRAANYGADFLVSPGSPAGLLESMLDTGRLVLPGVLSPTEVMHAHALGVTAVKLFPAGLVGPAGLHALRGPFPDVAFVPTGGIAVDDVGSWLDAGAHAVGVGSSLAPSSLRRASDVREVVSRVHRVLDAIQGRKPPPMPGDP